MSEQNKLIIAVFASVAFFFIIDKLFPSTHQPTTLSVSQTLENPNNAPAQNSGGQTQTFAQIGTLTQQEAIKRDQRIPIKTPLLEGSIRLEGAVLDDLQLTTYKETTDKNSPNVVLLSPKGTPAPYYTFVTYQSSLNPNACVTAHTLWTVEGDNKVLTPTTPITLVAKVDKGIVYKRHIQVDERYLFTIDDEIQNTTAEPVNLQSTALVVRAGKPATSGFFVLHEGGVGVLNHKLSEVSYDDIAKNKIIQDSTTGGWHGFTDKYWLTAIIPALDKNVTSAYVYDTDDTYKIKTVGNNQIIEKGQAIRVKHHIYAGSKVLSYLDDYTTTHHFDRFDLAVDFGWFYFLTKPLFYFLNTLNMYLHNMGYAILILTVLFKLLAFPLASKSHRSMAKMKTVQPKMEKLKKLYENDKNRFNQEVMNLYKKENINPASGCLPMLLQAPIFFCLYKVFFVTIEMRHAQFIGWIHDLAAPDPTTVFNLFGLIPWSPPSFLMLGALPLLMGLTMLVQQKLGPQPADPQQAKVMLIMPVIFTFMFASFPAGLVLYWAWSNILTILQQWYISRLSAKATVTIPYKKSSSK